ncbi:MAG: hypothetical protein KatS3mg111_2718 [Pirellulaceae bacterium]|nr:MAG: hypothetical protein KatS3mg111_2718 [Pirellulaceae bacterium]
MRTHYLTVGQQHEEEVFSYGRAWRMLIERTPSPLVDAPRLLQLDDHVDPAAADLGRCLLSQLFGLL